MLYNKIFNQTENTHVATVVSIIFGLILGLTIGSIVPPEYHLIGIIMSTIMGFFIGVLVLTGDTETGLCMMLLMPTISLTVFEIIFEMTANTLMYSWWVYGIILVIVTEILFFLDKTQPNTIDKDKVMQFTAGRKIEAFIEASIILVILKALKREFTSLDISIYYPTMENILVYALGIISIVLLMYIFVWINSFRYKKV